jgi:hypothetical protein
MLRAAFRRLLLDDRAQALTEYVILMGTLSLVCFFLIDPNNGIYRAIRELYDHITFVLVFPGP